MSSNFNNKYDVSPLIKTNIILSFFSFFGCLTIISLYIFRKILRSFVFSLVFLLSISELINSVGNIMSIHKLSDEKHDLICNIQSVIISYTDICSLAWMCIISYTIHDLMVNYNQDFSKKKTIFIIIGFIVPLIFTVVHVIIYYVQCGNESHMIDFSKIDDCWCWIYDMEDNLWFVCIVYAVYWVFILGNFFIILRVVSFLKRNCEEEEDKQGSRIRKMIYKLYLYPVLSGFCFVFATIHRLYQLLYIKNPNFTNKTNEQYRLEIILYLLHGMFISIRGFLFFLVYGCDRKVKKEMKQFFGACYMKMFKRYPEWAPQYKSLIASDNM